MNGNQEYEMKINRRIENAINESNNKTLLRRYRNYINDISLSSKYDYIKKVDSFLDTVGKEVEDITVDDISEYMVRFEFKEDGTRYSSNYRIGVYTALKHLFTYLSSSRVIQDNPMDAIKRPRAVEYQSTIEKREKGYLTKREIKTYIKTIMEGSGSKYAKAQQRKWKERDLAIVLLFLNTGIRCSALMKLDYDSVDLDNNQVIVTDKGNKVRRFDIAPFVMKALCEWMIKRFDLLKKEEDALFITKQGNRMTQTAISDVVKKFSVKIEGKNISPHKLRATYGTLLYEASNDIYFVQQCMGHSSPQTTELYVRSGKNSTKKASELMEKALGLRIDK